MSTARERLINLIDANTDQARLSDYGDVSFTSDIEELADAILAEFNSVLEWGVRIEGETPANTQRFDNEWAARECAGDNHSWCSTTPRIVEVRDLHRGPWALAP